MRAKLLEIALVIGAALVCIGCPSNAVRLERELTSSISIRECSLEAVNDVPGATNFGITGIVDPRFREYRVGRDSSRIYVLTDLQDANKVVLTFSSREASEDHLRRTIDLLIDYQLAIQRACALDINALLVRDECIGPPCEQVARMLEGASGD